MNTHSCSTIRFQLLLVTLAVCLTCASCSWQQVDKTSPTARRGHAMAFDSANNQVLLFGGNANTAATSGDAAINDTWEWDGHAWTKKFPVTMPPGRYKSALACDTDRHRVVLFGGTVGGHEVNDTWEWDGSNWQQLSPAHSPPARHHHAMAYDSNRKVVVLFGGFISTGDPANSDELVGSSGTADLGDTWEWNGTDWKQCSPATPPSPRDGHGLAYDEQRQVTVLFGGVQDVRNPENWRNHHPFGLIPFFPLFSTCSLTDGRNRIS